MGCFCLFFCFCFFETGSQEKKLNWKLSIITPLKCLSEILPTIEGRLQGMLDATIAEDCRLDIVEMFLNKFWDS